MSDAILAVQATMGATIAALTVWLTVRIVNGQKSWKCGLWGIGVLAFGFAAFDRNPFNIASGGLNSPAFLMLLVCFAGFLNSYWPTKRDHQ